jgi:hypothetical protein
MTAIYNSLEEGKWYEVSLDEKNVHGDPQNYLENGKRIYITNKTPPNKIRFSYTNNIGDQQIYDEIDEKHPYKYKEVEVSGGRRKHRKSRKSSRKNRRTRRNSKK